MQERTGFQSLESKSLKVHSPCACNLSAWEEEAGESRGLPGQATLLNQQDPEQ